VRAPTKPSATTPSSRTQQPVFYAGKVILDTGIAPPSPVAIVRYCNGFSRREAYTALDGSFSFVTGDRFNATTPEASDDTRVFNADNQVFRGRVVTDGLNSQQTPSLDCEVRAELAGYSSTAIRLDPSMNNSNIGIIMLHSRIKRADGMVTVGSLSVPIKARREYEKGSERLEKGELADAEKSLRKAIDLYPKFAEAWTRMGDLEQQRRNTDAAAQNYRTAIDTDPNLPLPYLRLAYLEAVASHWEETRQLSDKLISLDPTDFPMAYYYNAVAQFNLKQISKAEASALRAESLDQQRAEPRIELLLAAIYVARDSYSLAAEHYRAFLKLVPNGPISEKVKTDLAKVEQMADAQSHATQSPSK